MVKKIHEIGGLIVAVRSRPTKMERKMTDTNEARVKEWRPPVLRKLPIVATAQGKTGGNEGQGVGKGDASKNS